MDKYKFGRDGGMRGLPPGFRFEPTEEELVFEYLKCKVFCSALPASIIPEVNVWNFDPWDLPPGGDWEEERYLFSNVVKQLELGKNGRRIVWTPSGYWKAKLGSDRKIVSSNSSSSVFVGMKKTLVFYTNTDKGGRGRGSRTGWVMHEYRLISTQPQPQPVFNNNMEKWVLCRIFLKKFQSNIIINNNSLLHHYSDSGSDSDSVSSTASSSNSSSTSFFNEFTSPGLTTTTTTTTPLQQNSDDHFSAS